MTLDGTKPWGFGQGRVPGRLSPSAPVQKNDKPAQALRVLDNPSVGDATKK